MSTDILLINEAQLIGGHVLYIQKNHTVNLLIGFLIFFVCKLREKSDIKRVSTPPEPLSFILFIFTKKLYVYKQRPEMNILKA